MKLPIVLALASGASALKRDLHVVNNVIAPDGFKRSIVSVDGKFPAPLISGWKGENFSLNVIDELQDTTMLTSTSIHWHGFFQHGSNWADGSAFITQCPISPGHAFTYKLQSARQTGTYWYHAHHNTQSCDGLRGPFVVYDKDDPHMGLYDVDDESTIITVADWYHKPSLELNQIVGPVIADSTLINGRGRWSNNGTVDKSVPLSVVKVKRGKRYRMRLISLSCDPNYVFSIDHHTLTVIEVDGVATKPHTVDSIQIFTGQRYSFILNADKVEGNYHIRALPNSGTINFIGGVNTAILRYDGAPEADPTTGYEPPRMMLNEWDLHPLVPSKPPGSPAPGAVDKALTINITFNGSYFLVNDAAFSLPEVPVLLQILSGVSDPRELMPNGAVFDLPSNASVELTIPAGVVGGPHPFHLHGHSFHVIQSAGNATRNYEDPIIRDVVNIGEMGDNVTIRFTTDNPGPWILHCHIDFHLRAGMAVVFAEDIPHIASANPVPDEWKELCDIYNSLPSQL